MTQLVDHVSNPAEYSSKFDREGVLVVDPLVEEETIRQLRQRTDEISEGQVPYPDRLIELEPGTNTTNRSTIRKINVCHLHDEVFAAHAAKTRSMKECNVTVDLSLPPTRQTQDR